MKNKYLFGALIALLILAGCRKSDDYHNASNTSVSNKTIEEINDENVPKVCIDKHLPATGSQSHVSDAVLYKSNKWPNGQVLKVRFLNGTAFLKAKVMQYAKAWEPYANITFSQTTNAAAVAEIRVGFKINGDLGSWSYVGTDAKLIPQSQQTVNFGWFDDKTPDAEFSRVVTHEFGHAIGLVHEQSSPVEAIKWNKPVVYAYYEGPPNNWTKQQVDDNIFFKYSAQVTQYTAFDPASIMEYPVDPSFTTDHVGIGVNYYLSGMDKTFIATVYPKKGTMTDQDGNVMPTIKIGSQVWMAQNLRVTHFANGEAIPNITDKKQWAAQTGSAYCIYNNNASLVKSYGLLYNQYIISDARTICPAGWHIPTLTEWQTLVTYLGGNTVAGGAMKETGIGHWQTPNSTATNSSGFTALGGGWRDHLGNFSHYQTTAWWGYAGFTNTDTPLPSVDAADAAYGIVTSSTEGMLAGLSLRLVKNNGTL